MSFDAQKSGLPSKMRNLDQELQLAKSAVHEACKITRKVFAQLVQQADKSKSSITKDDKSPVTVADYASQAVINAILLKHNSSYKIVGEEDTSLLREDEGLQRQIVQLIQDTLSPSPVQSTSDLIKYIDAGSYAGGSHGEFWTLDPIDGTKGFLRGGQYAVCLALISQGIPVLGVIGCPNLDAGILISTIKGSGKVYEKEIDTNTERVVRGRNADSNGLNWSDTIFCESVESGHSAQTHQSLIAESLGITKPSLRMDSQAKYASLARGSADIYLRLPVKKDYQEKIWDHASGAVIIEEAGGRVLDIFGKPLDFGAGRTLINNKGILATGGGGDGAMSKLVETVAHVVAEKPLYT